MSGLRVVGGDLVAPRSPRRHLLSVADLGRDDVERLLATAASFAQSQERETKKLPTLRGRLIVNVFYESSTRTSSSFELAAKRLSADTLTLKAAGSSVDKGESLKDTALTLSAYDPDVIVIRHPEVGSAQFVAAHTDAHVVNAGDGKHQHPDAGAARPLHDPRSLRPARRPARRDRRRRAALARRPLARPGTRPRRRIGGARRPADADPARGSPRRRTTSTRSQAPTSSTSSACRASACSRARTSFPRRASTPRAGGSPRNGSGPASASCTQAR